MRGGGLEQQAVGAGFDAAGQVLFVGVAVGHREQGNAGVALAGFADHLAAADIGQAQVDQHHVGAEGAQQLQRLVPAGGGGQQPQVRRRAHRVGVAAEVFRDVLGNRDVQVHGTVLPSFE